MPNDTEPLIRALKECIAALGQAQDRLHLNDLDGEEGPFIEDCETAERIARAALAGAKG